VSDMDLCRSIVAAVERRAGERPVAGVRVQVGHLHHVHPEAFQQSFARAATGTVAEDATAELVFLPFRARCTACATEWECDEPPIACDLCGSGGPEVIGGDELVLESIEYRGTG
jgi:hydrogenase nickel incorporation protein HypA/HybF